MRRFPIIGAGNSPAKLLLGLTLLASIGGCNRDTPVDPNGVRRVAILVSNDTLRPGTTQQVSAIALNAADEIVEATITWQSLTPTKLLVNGAGTVAVLAPGVGILRASVGSVVAVRQLQLVNPPTAFIEASASSLVMLVPGAATQIIATPVDAIGIPIIGAELTWESDAPRIATVNDAGLVTPVAVGSTIVRAAVDGIDREIEVRVEPAPSPSAPIIESVSPSLIAPGTPFTIVGSQLRPSNGTTVLVDGLTAQLLFVSDTLITAVLSAASLPCLPSADVAVQVNASGGISAAGARLVLAPQLNPAVGEALILAAAGDLRCLELPGDGRYLISVLNTARAVGAGSLNLRLDAQSGLETPTSIRLPSVASAVVRNDAHANVLEASRRAVAQRGAAQLMPELQVAPVGELTAVRVPNLDAPNICTSYRPIHARTVYAGNNVYIVEDTATLLGSTPLLAGAMDAELQLLGAEIDNVIWPIITRFGDPLVMDSRLDDNDRIVIALTPELNAMQGGGVRGAVVTCDFYSRAQFVVSNVGEMLYLRVPTLAGGLDAATAIARWRHDIRGTVAHELKHVVSFAEHIVRNLPLEETWLEEATAQHAEELFTRALTGATPAGNTEYATIRCEILAAQGDGSCAGTPALMKPTLDGLWDFLSASASRSPLGAMSEGDFSYYGSGWSLLRWAMDHAVTPEATFTQQLTVSSQSGVSNLEARAGRTWEQMLARWSLALATDDHAGTMPADQTLRYQSWNFSSIFAGLCADLGPCGASFLGGMRYSRAHPALPLSPVGDFSLTIPDLAPAGFQLVEVAPGGAGTRRFVRLTAANGAPAPNTARLAILRID